jgi:YesN/AraC family two-component response regulator
VQKILIADDEAPIREWLEFCLRKSEHPCAITGMASNGEEALAMFLAERPDVLITDIRMPFMDGLELIGKLRRLAPSLGIIVLSSHDDFSYVRTAMKAGACEYILKTEITESMLAGILARLEDSRRADRSADPVRLVAKRTMLLRRLLTPGDETLVPGGRELGDCGIFLSDSSLFAVALRFDAAAGLPSDLAEPSNPLFSFANRISNTAWFPNDSGTAILAANMSESPSLATRLRILRDFIVELSAHFHSSAGASSLHPGTAFLGLAMREALGCLELDFYTGRGSWNLRQEKELHESGAALEAYRERALEPLLSGDSASALARLEEISEYLSQNRPLPVSGVKSFFLDLLEATASYRERSGADRSRARSALENSGTLRELTETFRHEIRAADSLAESGKYSQPVRKAIAHIAANSLKNAGLDEAASISRLNPDYFSRLFKEETGRNFVSWLSDLKIKRAITLLRETNLKVYEIADEIGYSNLGYFSRVFKKQTGKNPFEFRNGMGGREE